MSRLPNHINVSCFYTGVREVAARVLADIAVGTAVSSYHCYCHIRLL